MLVRRELGRIIFGVGILIQLTFFPQWVSAASVNCRPIAYGYCMVESPSKKPDKNHHLPSLENRQALEDISAKTQDPNKREDSSSIEFFRVPDQEIASADGEMEDPFGPSEDEIQEPWDPFESHNRFMFDFNNTLYDYFGKHVTKGYRFAVPYEARVAVKNVINNGMMPVRLLNSLLQGDIEKSGRVVRRFIVNSILGLGGIFDVAKEFDIEPVNENMTQTLGFYNVPSGPYLVLPIFGPSSARNLIGRTADIFASPTFLLSAPFEVNAGIAVVKKTNETSFLIKTYEEIKENSVDEYISVRDLYHQHHYSLVNE
jgi:phospholipid-binding lipoprotein MlaA